MTQGRGRGLIRVAITGSGSKEDRLGWLRVRPRDPTEDRHIPWVRPVTPEWSVDLLDEDGREHWSRRRCRYVIVTLDSGWAVVVPWADVRVLSDLEQLYMEAEGPEPPPRLEDL